MIGATRLGSSSRKMIVKLLAPSDRLASTNSCSRSERVLPRTTRAMLGHENRAITNTTNCSPGFISPPKQPSAEDEQAPTMPMAKRSSGKDRRNDGGRGD